MVRSQVIPRLAVLCCCSSGMQLISRGRYHRIMFRRSFLKTACALPAASLFGADSLDLAAEEKPRVLRGAKKYLEDPPITVTAASSPRSTGGKHDYFSEGDYWWPDPKNPSGPYIQRDGLSNPDNFVAHREALIRLSVQVPALAAAWMLTRESRYAIH